MEFKEHLEASGSETGVPELAAISLVDFLVQLEVIPGLRFERAGAIDLLNCAVWEFFLYRFIHLLVLFSYHLFRKSEIYGWLLPN